MATKREKDACSLCAHEACSLCTCTDPPTLLCERCKVTHLSGNQTYYHGLLPKQCLAFLQVPGYLETLQKRQREIPKVARRFKTELNCLVTWRQEICTEVDRMITRLTQVRTQISKEMADLYQTITSDIDAAEQEIKANMYQEHPNFDSAIAKAMWDYKEGGCTLISCNTRAQELQAAFNRFLFSMNVSLQVELPRYIPQGSIRSKDDIRMEKKVNVYLPPSALLAAIHKFQLPADSSAFEDLTPTIKRGWVDMGNGLYLGEWNENNEPHGFGKYFWKVGQVYIGQFRNDKRHGRGTNFEQEKCSYTGDWVRDKMHGFGKYQWIDGSDYVGEWVRDLRQGFGVTHFAEDSDLLCYFGCFANDQRHGQGAEFKRDGSLYIGDFQSDFHHGQGLEYKDNQYYYGDFQHDQYHGYGLCLVSDGSGYCGDWEHSLRHGKGKEICPGNYFLGKWDKGQEHGSRIYYSSGETQRKRRRLE